MFYDRETDAELTYAFVSGDTALTVRVEGVGDSATAYLLANSRSSPVSVTLTAIDPDSATASHSWSVSIRQANPGTTDPVNPPPPPPPPPPVTPPPPPVVTPPPPPPDTTTYCASNGSNCSAPAAPGRDKSLAIQSRTETEVTIDASAAFIEPTNWGSGPQGTWSSGTLHIRHRACSWAPDDVKIGCTEVEG